MKTVMIVILTLFCIACTENEYVNENEGVIYYADNDADGYGAGTAYVGDEVSQGFVTNNLDCDDNAATINPLANEICTDGLDNDCSGKSDNGCWQVFSSLDQYDGYLKKTPTADSFIFDETVESWRVYTGGVWSDGIITFDLSARQSGIKTAKLKVFLLGLNNCQGYELVWLEQYKLPESDYKNWESCIFDKTWPYGSCYIPAYWDSLSGSGKSFEMTSMGNGWWQLDSPEFVNFLENAPRNKTTFALSLKFSGGIGACEYQASFEDGGNHGGTDNLPTLTISY